MGFQDFGNFHSRHPAIRTTGLLTLALAGLPPAEHTSVTGRNNRTCQFPASCTSYARSSEGSAAVAGGVERSETTRATAGDGPERRYLSGPSRFAGSNRQHPAPHI